MSEITEEKKFLKEQIQVFKEQLKELNKEHPEVKGGSESFRFRLPKGLKEDFESVIGDRSMSQAIRDLMSEHVKQQKRSGSSKDFDSSHLDLNSL